MVSLAVENLLELKCLAFLFYQPTAVTAALGGYVWIWDMGGYVWRSFAGKKRHYSKPLSYLSRHLLTG